MKNLQGARVCLLVLALAPVYWSPGIGAAQSPDNEPPIAGRPEDFSELVGFYEISSTAHLTEVRVEDPLLLTVKIKGSGPRAYQPERRHLRVFPPAIANDFYIEPLPDQDRVLTEEKAWEFSYRLRPKRQDVKRVPSLKLVYYSPARQRFQSSYSDAIELAVKPRPVAQAPANAVESVRPPARTYELATGPGVLRRLGRAALPWPAFLLLLLLPPGSCALWYWRWRRLHPDHAELARGRHSRAGQLALQTLRREESLNADQVFDIVTAYLRSRFDLAAVEPTQSEVARQMTRLGVSKGIQQKVSAFFDGADAARFLPSPPPEAAGLANEAVIVVQALEGEARFSAVTTPRRGRRPRSGRTRAGAVASLVLLGFATLRAQEPPRTSPISDADLLARAEAAFQEGKANANKPGEARQAFGRSADVYEELYRRGVDNPELCRNLGNAALLSGRLARAIRAFAAGLQLAPNDSSLRENLEYARSRVQYPVGTRMPEPWWPAAIPRPTTFFLQCSTLVLCALTCVFATRRWITGRGTLPVVLFAAATLFTGTALALLQWQACEDERQPLVVIAVDDTALQRGNSTSYPRHPTLPVVNEGMEARRLAERGDWLQIEFPGGQIGWVRKKSVVRGYPESFLGFHDFQAAVR